MKLAGKLSIRSSPALLGIFLAWHLMVTVVAFAPVLIAAPVEAAKPITCFMKGECIDAKTQGNCDSQHCFEARNECPPGQGLCYVNPPAVPLIIAIGGKDRAVDLSDYIAMIFNYGVSAAGAVATVMFMVGGFQVLSAGDSDRVKKGKERIKNAIIGMLLAFGALIMLRTVNPDLLKLQMPKIEITKKKTIATCAFTEMCEPCGVPYVVLTDKQTNKTAVAVGQCEFAKLRSQLSEADLAKYDTSDCVGMGCGGGGSAMVASTGSETRCNINLFRCNRAQAGDKFECGHAPDPLKDQPPAPAGTSGGFVCKSCRPDGASCTSTGKNDQCCGGFCADQAIGSPTCASGQPGDDCQDGKQCISGICQTNWGNSCSSGEIGSPCGDDNKECKQGYRCATEGKNVCSPGLDFSLCDADSECNGGRTCMKLTGYDNVCVSGKTEADFKRIVCPVRSAALIGGIDDCCNSNKDCAGRGGYCNQDGYNFCTDGSPGAPCDADDQCAPYGTNTHGICFANKMCSTGALGAGCKKAEDCSSGHCSKAGDFGVCVSGGTGSRCAGSADCNQGLVCTKNRCVSTADAG